MCGYGAWKNAMCIFLAEIDLSSLLLHERTFPVGGSCFLIDFWVWWISCEHHLFDFFLVLLGQISWTNRLLDTQHEIQ